MEETEPEMAKTQEPVSQVRNTGLDHTVYSSVYIWQSFILLLPLKLFLFPGI